MKFPWMSFLEIGLAYDPENLNFGKIFGWVFLYFPIRIEPPESKAQIKTSSWFLVYKTKKSIWKIRYWKSICPLSSCWTPNWSWIITSINLQTHCTICCRKWRHKTSFNVQGPVSFIFETQSLSGPLWQRLCLMNLCYKPAKAKSWTLITGIKRCLSPILGRNGIHSRKYSFSVLSRQSPWFYWWWLRWSHAPNYCKVHANDLNYFTDFPSVQYGIIKIFQEILYYS